jgi:hypothetical protein
MEIQTNSNYIDWTSLSLVELTGLTYSSRSVPQGLEQDIDIATLNFVTPIWLTTPAKVKKLGVITKIITSIFDEQTGDIALNFTGDSGSEYFAGRNPVSVSATTLGNFSLMVLNNQARLIPPGTDVSQTYNWYSILDQYPGKFTAGLSQIWIPRAEGGEMVGHISLDPSDDTIMHVAWDNDLRPYTEIPPGSGKTYVDAIIDPTTFVPVNPATGIRYLILEDINTDPRLASVLNTNDAADAWRNTNGTHLVARANDIIEWQSDGVSGEWHVIFDAVQNTDMIVYQTNIYTGVFHSFKFPE